MRIRSIYRLYLGCRHKSISSSLGTQSLLPVALKMSLLPFTEAMANLKAVAQQVAKRLNRDQELGDPGLPNFTFTFFSSHLINRSLKRSGVEVAAGTPKLISAICVTSLLTVNVAFVSSWVRFLLFAVIADLLLIAASCFIIFCEIRQVCWDRAALTLTFFGSLTLSLGWVVLLGRATAQTSQKYAKHIRRDHSLGRQYS